jgi:phenylalanyl-tRNA synthetase beta chain
LPSRSIAPVAKNTSRVLKQSIRDSLSRAGANEVLTYSFVHKNVLTGAGQDPTHAYRLSNALSPELQYYRLSLMPSLLDKVHMNIKAGNGSFALYEIGKSHCKGEMDANDPNVPNEDTHVALVVAANDKERQPGAPFYLARTYLEQIARLEDFQMVAMASFDMSNDVRGQQLSAMYAPSRAMVIVKDDQIWGVVGEYAPAVQRRFKLPMFAAGFEVHLSMLQQHDITYASLSRYPSVTQDISLAVATDCTYNTVFERLLSSLITENPEVRCMLHPITIYQGIDDQNRKTLTFRVTVTSDTHTLQDSMVTAMLHSAVEQLARDIPVAVA